MTFGMHKLTIFAIDTLGNLASSKTTHFTIAEPEPEPTPTIMVIAVIASVVVISLGLLVYFKKRKR